MRGVACDWQRWTGVRVVHGQPEKRAGGSWTQRRGPGKSTMGLDYEKPEKVAMKERVNTRESNHSRVVDTVRNCVRMMANIARRGGDRAEERIPGH